MKKVYTKEELQELANNSTSKRNFHINLGYSPNSGCYQQKIDKLIEEYNLNTDHFTGQAWNKNMVDKGNTFKVGVKVKSEKLRRALFILRGCECEHCHLDEWMGELIPLEVHHINGNPLDNKENNLQLLCANCHSLTDNYRNKKRAPEQETL